MAKIHDPNELYKGSVSPWWLFWIYVALPFGVGAWWGGYIPWP